MTLRLVQDEPGGVEGKPPPHDLGAERAVLSAVILDPAAIIKVNDFLQPAHFFGEAHRRMFEACERIFRRREPIDAVTVASELRAMGRLAQVGGAPAVQEVLDGAPVVQNVRKYGLTVHECWRQRQVILACQRIAATGYGPVDDVQRYCDSAARTLATLGLRNPARPIETLTEALDRLLAHVTGAEPTTPKRDGKAIPTGIHTLDRKILGMFRKNKTTIAARRGGGKTALGMQIAMRVAKFGVGVLFFSSEVQSDEMTRRMVANESGVSATKIKLGTLSREEITAVFEASNRLKDLPMRFDYSPRLTAASIRSITEAYAEESMLVHRVPLGLVVVDYVQRLLPPPEKSQREEREQFAHSTRELKMMSQELDIAVLELAQAGTPKVDGKRTVRSCYGSAVIENESDVVIHIVRDPHADPEAEVKELSLELTKQRDGAEAPAFPIRFYGSLYRFEDPNAPAGADRQYVDTNPLTEGL